MANFIYRNQEMILPDSVELEGGNKMVGKLSELMIGDRVCSLYLPPGYQESASKYPVVYALGGKDFHEAIELIEPHFGKECEPFILLGISSENWNEDFSPWMVPKLFKNEEPFSGGAGKFLSNLEGTIKPYMDANYKTKTQPEDNAIIGYSLAGLTALYALYRSDAFKRIACLSGSLWFEEFIEFMDSNKPKSRNAKVYLSLGKNEEKTRNQRMAPVGLRTRKAYDILLRELSDEKNFLLEWNPGGHFDEIPKRYQQSLLWLMSIPR